MFTEFTEMLLNTKIFIEFTEIFFSRFEFFKQGGLFVQFCRSLVPIIELLLNNYTPENVPITKTFFTRVPSIKGFCTML